MRLSRGFDKIFSNFFEIYTFIFDKLNFSPENDHRVGIFSQKIRKKDKKGCNQWNTKKLCKRVSWINRQILTCNDVQKGYPKKMTCKKLSTKRVCKRILQIMKYKKRYKKISSKKLQIETCKQCYRKNMLKMFCKKVFCAVGFAGRRANFGGMCLKKRALQKKDCNGNANML